MLETVIKNSYGKTAQQFSMPNWQSEYQRYLSARCDAHVQLWLTTPQSMAPSKLNRWWR